jgi:hypothetical protein
MLPALAQSQWMSPRTDGRLFGGKAVRRLSVPSLLGLRQVFIIFAAVRRHLPLTPAHPVGDLSLSLICLIERGPLYRCRCRACRTRVARDILIIQYDPPSIACVVRAPT